MICYIGIGSNLGDRKRNINKALELLNSMEGITVNKISPIYETEPVGGPKQPKYLNGVIKIDTLINPRQLLTRLKEIENSLGRFKTVKDGPRTIDLDILAYGDINVNDEDLIIPHPRMNEREFVQKPLRDLLQNEGI